MKSSIIELMTKKSLLWLIVIIVIVIWVFKKINVNWRGFYYIGGNFGEVIYSPVFKTKEDCISWAENEWKSHPRDKQLDSQNLYECGKNCKLDNATNPENGIYICDVTFDGGDWRRGDYGE